MATTSAAPRSAAERKQDVLARLEADKDAWVSTASPDGMPTLVPLSFVWHDGTLVMCTRATNPTTHNLQANDQCRIALGHTRDVVLVECTAEVLRAEELPVEAGEAFVRKLAWDPRGDRPWIFLRFQPVRILAWREVNELADRELMRDGSWLV